MAWRAGALYSRSILAKKIQFVVAGAVLMIMHEWSLMQPFVFFGRFRLAPPTNIPPPGRLTGTAPGGNLIGLETTRPHAGRGPEFCTHTPAGLPTMEQAQNPRGSFFRGHGQQCFRPTSLTSDEDPRCHHRCSGT